jgi:hypothetical protein
MVLHSTRTWPIALVQREGQGRCFPCLETLVSSINHAPASEIDMVVASLKRIVLRYTIPEHHWFSCLFPPPDSMFSKNSMICSNFEFNHHKKILVYLYFSFNQ